MTSQAFATQSSTPKHKLVQPATSHAQSNQSTARTSNMVHNEPSKASGHTDQVLGQIKQSIGGAIGNHHMEAEGAARKEEGKAEVNAAKAENRADAAGKDIRGHVKDAVGGLIGDHTMQGEGKADKARADVQREANRF